MARVIKRAVDPQQSFIEDFVEGDKAGGTIAQSIMPAVNIYDQGSSYLLTLAAPGYDAEELQLKIEDNILTISSRRKMTSQEAYPVIRAEFQYAGFQRTFRLPSAVDEDTLEKSYEKGILRVKLHKKQEPVH